MRAIDLLVVSPHNGLYSKTAAVVSPSECRPQDLARTRLQLDHDRRYHQESTRYRADPPLGHNYVCSGAPPLGHRLPALVQVPDAGCRLP